MQRFTVLAALAASASAYHVSIKNNCDRTAYIWSCGDTLGPMETLEPGAAPWTEDFYTKAGGGGPSIYVSDTQDRSSGHAQFEYYVDQASTVWWDLSLIDGDPFSGQRVSVGSDLQTIPYEACQPVQCSGVGPCAEAYLTHTQLLGTHDCPASNLVMNLCDESGEWNAGADHSSDNNDDSNDGQNEEQPEPAPAPTPAPAPAAPAPPAAVGQILNAIDGNVQQPATTIITSAVSAAAPAPAAAQTPSGVWVGADGLLHGKRSEHQHGHAHNHNHKRVYSRLFRRHSHGQQA